MSRPNPLNHLLESNRKWSERIRAEDPLFFKRLAAQQFPEYLWIGCSDSRVPANQVVDIAPGEVFVHRNIANVVVPSDLNSLSVIQYAVDVLQVKHIIVVGHYGCGGIRATLENLRFGLVDNWLRHVKDVQDKHQGLLDHAPHDRQLDLLCELNVLEQMLNVCQTTVVRDAWQRCQQLTVHGWVYSLEDGRVRLSNLIAASPAEALRVYAQTMEKLTLGVRV